MKMLPVRLLPEARAEFDQAIDWYAEIDRALAIDFVAKIRDVFERISLLSQLHTVVYRNVRKAAVKRFPYVVVYQTGQGEVIVISIIHTARHDEVWIARVQ